MPGPDQVIEAGTPLRPAARRWPTALACGVFTLYAGCFLYFFVDDEAIPLVYARNLLRGRGLVYTSLEGRVEGYSDFLHVLWSAGVMAVTRGLGLSPIAPLLVGKAVSFAAAIGLIGLTARALRRAGASTSGMAAALGFLALSGPLAVWSASSLETVTFALAVAAFAATLYAGDRERAVVVGIVAILLRIDGPIYVTAVIVAAIAADLRRWREHVVTACPIGVALLAYHLWRQLYFGSVLTAPLTAKVLHRITGSGHDIVKAPEVQYVLSYLRTYGVAAGFALAAAAVAAWHSRPARMAICVLLLLGVYVDIVDDWMFGFRFMVALLPFAALVIGIAITRLRGRAAPLAAAAVVLWSAVGAWSVLEAYKGDERRPLFWTNMHAGEPAWFGRYYAVLDAGRRLLHAGDRVSDNQAGLIPYMLDLENIDDLGICSGFVAHLPTTDVYFTGVGRYSPLTNDAVLRTAHEYLLYRDVRFIITPMDLLLKANAHRVPERLLNNAFERIAVDAWGQNAIYRRTDASAASYRPDRSAFSENVAHTTHIVRASIDGSPLSAAEIGPRLGMLRENTAVFSFNGRLQLDLTLADHDEDLHGLYVARLAASSPGLLSVTIINERGEQLLHDTIALAAGQQTILREFPPGTRGTSVRLELVSPDTNRVTLTDMRITGQSHALHLYLRRTLHFPGF